MNYLHNTADYCAACGQPRERSVSVERFGLRLLPGGTLLFGKEQTRLSPYEGEYMRTLIERGRASHELLILRLETDADDQVTRVYAHRLKKKLLKLTGGAITVRSIWGWGYELAETALAEAA